MTGGAAADAVVRGSNSFEFSPLAMDMFWKKDAVEAAASGAAAATLDSAWAPTPPSSSPSSSGYKVARSG